MIDEEPTVRMNAEEPEDAGIEAIVSTALAFVTAAEPISGPMAVDVELPRAAPAPRDARLESPCRNA